MKKGRPVFSAQDRAPSARWLWGLLLALSPLAASLGVWLTIQMVAAMDLRFQVDRGRAAAIAQEFSRSRNFTGEDLKVFIATEATEKLYAYYRFSRSELATRLRAEIPDVVVRVMQVSPDKNQVFETRLGPDGRVLGFTERASSETVRIGLVTITENKTADLTTAAAGDVDEAARLAETAFLAKKESLDFIDFGPPEIKTERDREALTRLFVWKGKSGQLPALEVSHAIQVHGSRIISDTLSASIDPDYAEANLSPYRVAKNSLLVALFLAALLVSIYALVRYVKKSREKETSHRRNFTLGLLVAAAFSVAALTIAFDSIGMALRTTPRDPVFIISIVAVWLTYGFFGILLGIYWGSSEGEVREAFPGKLTSLDALVVGRVFSRNVARSFLTGTALGGWGLLLSALARLPWTGSPTLGMDVATVGMAAYSRNSTLVSLTSPVLATVPVAILGLLLPLTFALRHVAAPRLRAILLGFLAWLGCLWIAMTPGPLPAILLYALAVAATLLFSFFFCDLLTAMVALSAHGFAGNLILMGVSTSFSQQTIVTASGILAAGLLIQAYFYSRGREYSEEEVRPLYAEHLAQRRAMQAEVSAAREAQVRMSPQQVPRLEGLELAAECRPARIVGGDFFDFFTISDRKLAIFFAEGGGGGIPAALSIAFAKGLLLPLVARRRSPPDIVSRLSAKLAPLSEPGAKMGILYAVIDTTTGILSYARLGDYPKLLLMRGDRDLGFSMEHADGRHGEINIAAGDRVILFTDEVERVLQASGVSPQEWIGQFLQQKSGRPVAQTHQAFMGAIQKRVRQARRAGAEDDLSAILLRLNRRVAAAKEEVA